MYSMCYVFLRFKKIPNLKDPATQQMCKTIICILRTFKFSFEYSKICAYKIHIFIDMCMVDYKVPNNM